MLLLRISRPRFWIYLLGPALIGMAAALSTGGRWSWLSALLFIAYTLPANLFLYGVNDIFDYETDRMNPKKDTYEQLLDPRHVKTVFAWIVAMLLPFVVLLSLLPRAAFASFVAFLFLGACYSVPPIRAKTRPFIDTLFNVLYIFPGLTTWYAFGGGVPSLRLLAAGAAWCMAMHAYSVIPDIEIDRGTGVRTIATTLGKEGTLLLCTVLYLAAAGIVHVLLGSIGLLCGIVYAGLMLLSFRAKTSEGFYRFYRWFPFVHTVVGVALFFWILITRTVI